MAVFCDGAVQLEESGILVNIHYLFDLFVFMLLYTLCGEAHLWALMLTRGGSGLLVWSM